MIIDVEVHWCSMVVSLFVCYLHYLHVALGVSWDLRTSSLNVHLLGHSPGLRAEILTDNVSPQTSYHKTAGAAQAKGFNA